MMRKFLETISRWLPTRVIYDRSGKRPYLSRHYVIGMPRMADGSDPFDEFGEPKNGAIWPAGVSVMLHHFHQSDEDREHLHSHPWVWSRSLILVGGYLEERVSRIYKETIRTHAYKPGDWNRIDQEDCHRVDLIQADCWTLFIAGPKASSWGFVNRRTFKRTGWREHLENMRMAASPRVRTMVRKDVN